jgi:hypothetical protein
MTILLGIINLIGIYLCIKGIRALAKAEVWQPILDYMFIIFGLILSLIYMAITFINKCIEIKFIY